MDMKLQKLGRKVLIEYASNDIDRGDEEEDSEMHGDGRYAYHK
jgi:hypothetical protein